LEGWHCDQAGGRSEYVRSKTVREQGRHHARTPIASSGASRL
jgi:hypothetical protein